MMMLTRKIGEKIMIGDDVVITVVDISHGKARLGFEAPRSVNILRGELITRKEKQDAENQAKKVANQAPEVKAENSEKNP